MRRDAAREWIVIETVARGSLGTLWLSRCRGHARRREARLSCVETDARCFRFTAA